MMTMEHDTLYAACASEYGLVVKGSAKALRRARDDLRDDIALSHISILGPDQDGNVWIVKKDALHDHLLSSSQEK